MIDYPFAIILGIIALAFYLVISIILKVNKKKIVLTSIFICYLTVVVMITIFPIPLEKIEYFGNKTWYNYIPFNSIKEVLANGLTKTAFLQIVGNILLSVPFGAYVIAVMKNKRWWKLLIFALGFTVLIESTQLVIDLYLKNMYRNVDIDDVILNALGAYIGYGIYKIIPKKIKETCLNFDK